MSADFTTIYPPDGGEPWEAACDWCGAEYDLDHYGDMENHTYMHREEEAKAQATLARGGPRHRKE